jgi:hypothetical protein
MNDERNFVSDESRSGGSSITKTQDEEKNSHLDSRLETIANITGIGYEQLCYVSKEYDPLVVEAAGNFLKTCLGAVESAAYLENFKQQLEYYRSLLQKRTSSKEKTTMSRVCKFLLGRSEAKANVTKHNLLPDYVFLEIIHNHNYVFMADADDIIKSPNLTQIMDYRVDSSQLFHICSARSIKCQACHPVPCQRCRELMSNRRYNTLKVIVTMYLLPLMSDEYPFLRKMIIEKKTGMTPGAMFALAGYSYYNAKRNYVGLGKDDAGLDIFDTPPRTDILMERIIQAIESRQGK